MSDMKEPIKFYNRGLCPKCRQCNLAINEYSADHIILDDDGFPGYHQNVSRQIVVCPNCNFSGELGKDFIMLEDGSIKYVTEAERIYEINRMKNLAPITHLHADNNPFMEEK